MISQQEMKEILKYNPETGVFIWIKPRTNRVKVGSVCGYHDKTNGYIVSNIGGIKHYLHRMAFVYMRGECPKYVDHIDGDKTNNKFCNLRVCTASQNNCNVKKRVDNTSGHKSVYWHKAAKKWAVEVKINGEKVFKTFDDKALAFEFSKRIRDLMHLEFARVE